MSEIIPTPVTGHTLVDLDVTIRVVGTEIPVPSDVDLDALKASVRDYLARQTVRSMASVDPVATVAVTVVLRQV